MYIPKHLSIPYLFPLCTIYQFFKNLSLVSFRCIGVTHSKFKIMMKTVFLFFCSGEMSWICSIGLILRRFSLIMLTFPWILVKLTYWLYSPTWENYHGGNEFPNPFKNSRKGIAVMRLTVLWDAVWVICELQVPEFWQKCQSETIQIREIQSLVFIS